MISVPIRRRLIFLIACLLFLLSRFYRASVAVITIAATPLVLMVQAVGWRNSFLVIAGINLVLTVFFYLIARDRPESSVRQDVPKTASTQFREIRINLRQLFGEKNFWIISLGTFCRYGIFAAVQSLWAAPFLINVIGVSVVSADNLLLLMSMGMVVGSPIVGWLSDAVLKKRKAIIVTGLIAMGAVLALLTRLSSGTSMTVLCILFFGFGFFSNSGGFMYAHIKEQMPAERADTAMTGINFFTMIGVAAFLQGLGNMMQSIHPGSHWGIPHLRMRFYSVRSVCGLPLFSTCSLSKPSGKNNNRPSLTIITNPFDADPVNT